METREQQRLVWVVKDPARAAPILKDPEEPTSVYLTEGLEVFVLGGWATSGIGTTGNPNPTPLLILEATPDDGRPWFTPADHKLPFTMYAIGDGKGEPDHYDRK